MELCWLAVCMRRAVKAFNCTQVVTAPTQRGPWDWTVGRRWYATLALVRSTDPFRQLVLSSIG